MNDEQLLQIIFRAARDKATKLDLSGQGLTQLPAQIGQLSYLSWLDLSNNQLTTLPAQIAQLSNLTALYLYNNQLTTLPAQIAQLSNLTALYLSNNQLTTLPAQIAQLSNLTALNLSNNQLTTLPAQIAQLSNLSLLDLSNNQLTTLPAQIAQLSNLSWLDLSYNQLTTLPAQIAQLSNLTALYLYNNQLTTLPREIQKLSKLERLDLRGNQLNIPPEILGTDWDKLGEPSKVLSYYFSLQAEARKPLNEAKVLLVGQGSVGKTSLVKRLIDNYYNPHENKTEGINIRNWQVRVNDQDVQLNVWDFGGQEIMHATHQFFLTKRSLYLLVLDARVDERQNQLEDWLKIIESFGGDSPIIIVGNKIDQHPLDIDERGLRQKYPNIREIVPVSCQDGRGLNKLRSIIARELSQLQHIHDLLPESWFRVKTCLEEMEQDYIIYSEYENICKTEQVSEQIKQATLIELLHQLGIVLNFRDDPRLEDTHVLNPEWVTNGVYKILNDNLLMTGCRGILDLSNLQRILNDRRYPRNKQMFIVDMMQKFELCFPLEDGQGQRFLIPDLLPKEEPATGEWENSLVFQYHYNVLPSSIISRFIVRMHHKSDKQTWWRSGIVLKDGDNRALVKSDREDRKIYIFIIGEVSTRRELLAAIRSQFDAIHRTIIKIEAKEKVGIPGQSFHIVADYKTLLNYEKQNLLNFIPEGLSKPYSVKDVLNGIESEVERSRKVREYERIEAESVFYPPTKPSTQPNMNNEQQPPEPPKQPISSAERGIILACAVMVLAAFLFLVLNPRAMNGGTLAIVRFLAATLAGIIGYLFSGTLGLEAKIPLNKTQIKATGAFAAFVLVLLIFYLGIPASDAPVQPTPTPSP